MVPYEIKAAIELVNQLWDSLRGSALVSGASALAADILGMASDVVASTLAGWHGYGWRQDENGFVFTLFVRKPADLEPVQSMIEQLAQQVRVEALVTPPFRQMKSGKSNPLPVTLQPGNIVFSANDAQDCPFSCAGTIGGFLTGKQANGVQTSWLLSNQHVLGECVSASQAFGADNALIGADIRRVQAQKNGFLVDAAVVKIEDPSKINPKYDGLGPLTNAVTPPELKSPDIVQKLGNATGLTSGTFAFHCPRVTVFHCSKTGSEVYLDQLAFVSDNKGVPFADNHGKPFADEGDSGSLIVKKETETPVGLLFAKSFKVDPTITGAQGLKPPFFLANPWDVVVQQVSAIVQAPVVLMLQQVNPAVIAPVNVPVIAPVSSPVTPPVG